MATIFPKRWRALTGISILCLVGFIDFTVVNTILPGIQRELQATVDELQWVMNAFFLMLTVFMVTTGRLGDIYGRRRVFYLGVIAFALSSFLAGTSESPQFLIACRFLQGIAGAVMFTCATALVSHHFPEAEQGRALAVFMSITGFGMAVGPVLGGLFLAVASWRWAFYVNLPVVVAGFLVAWPAVAETPRQEHERLDWLGLALLTPGMGALVTSIVKGNNWGWNAPATVMCAGAGALFLTSFVLVERRVASPIIDFKLFRQPKFLASSVVALTLGGFIAVGNFLAPQYLQTVRNEAPYVAGLMLLPISSLVVIVPPLIGKLADRKGPTMFLAAGQAILAFAALTQIFFAAESPMWLVLWGLALFGLGWGLQQATSAQAATSSFPPAASGVAIGVLYSIWNFGSSVGLAVGGLIFEELDRRNLTTALSGVNMPLAGEQQKLVRSLLSDPSQVHHLLAKLAPGLETRILAMFKNSFMAGYSGAMWYLLATCIVGAILVPLIARNARGPA